MRTPLFMSLLMHIRYPGQSYHCSCISGTQASHITAHVYQVPRPAYHCSCISGTQSYHCSCISGTQASHITAHVYQVPRPVISLLMHIRYPGQSYHCSCISQGSYGSGKVMENWNVRENNICHWKVRDSQEKSI